MSTALDLVADFGIDPENAFGFWSWVGGRYSVDSAVGLSLIVALGPERFQGFLEGFHEVDQYFVNTPVRQERLLRSWAFERLVGPFLGAESHAICRTTSTCTASPALPAAAPTMESNASMSAGDGTPSPLLPARSSGASRGTTAQHAFYQLIHQRHLSRLSPLTSSRFVNTPNAVRDNSRTFHELFLGNFSLDKGPRFCKTVDEVRAEGTAEWMVPARCFEGNRPTTSIFGVDLTPHALGALIALYEHITFIEGAVWGIDSYDQWGVELGKQLGHTLDGYQRP